jgi:hypothetical protein
MECAERQGLYVFNKMFNEYLEPDTDEDHPTGKLEPFFKEMPDSVTRINSCNADSKCDDSDDRNGEDYIHVEDRKTQANREGIETRGNGEEKKGGEVRTVYTTFSRE